MTDMDDNSEGTLSWFCTPPECDEYGGGGFNNVLGS